MNNLKKILSVLLAFVLVLGLAACGNGENKDTSESSEASQTESTAGKADTKFDDNSLYLITDLGEIDDKSFNQGSFEGLKKFAEEIGVKANYIKPAGEGDQIYQQAVEQAIQAGAKVVVTPGFLFETAVGNAQELHPDVHFIAVDFEPAKVLEGQVDEQGNPKKETKVGPNTMSLLFKEQDSGFLAGYLAVKDGYKNLGFMGGVAVPAVVRFGFGYIAGANYAAKELGTNVKIKYTYTNSFVEKPEIQTQAASWYKAGTDCIFACGGKITFSILKAAQAPGNEKVAVIGVDSDQSQEGEQIITSAMKNLVPSVYQAAKDIYEGKFKGGSTQVYGIQEDGVKLPIENSRFKNLGEAEYNEIYKALKENKDGIYDTLPKDFSNFDPTSIAANYTNVSVEYLK